MTRSAPRYAGKITTWKDEQGYGYITPNGGGATVFVHAKSFGGRGKRPGSGDVVTYHVVTKRDGQLRAENVEFAADRLARRRTPAPGPGTGSLIATAAFLVFVCAAVLFHKLPFPVLGIYLGMSVVTYLAYHGDKSAARAGRSRTPEDTLHILALAGGSPGALLAQKRLRQKTVKEPFRTKFLLSVIANCGVLAWLLSPLGAPLRGLL
jgi:uncharacterized membrane protein YsdA (DUF1294 family)/cold shock CspA family protein